jgi:GDSL-like Lipase/Acylhydrolase family
MSTPAARISVSGPVRFRQRPGAGWLLAALTVLGTLAGAEFGFRALAPSFGIEQASLDRVRETMLRMRASWYQPRPYYGWALAESLTSVKEHWFYGPAGPIERIDGIPRVLCLGGSTTAGGNSLGHEGSFPYYLQEILSARLGCPVEVINAGISGWTSAEMLCAWFLYFKDYKPDVLVIHEAVNDSEARMRPGFRRDYAHWRQAWNLPRDPGWLMHLVRRSDLVAWARSVRPPPELRDATVAPYNGPSAFDGQALPAETIAPLRRNWLSLIHSLEEHGGTTLFATLPPQPPDPTVEGTAVLAFRAGIAEHNRLMRTISAERGCLLSDLEAAALQRDQVELRKQYLDLVHVAPEINRWKAEGIAAVILEGLPGIAKKLKDHAGGQ